MNVQLEVETQLRQKIKELKKKSNARRNSLKQLQNAYARSERFLAHSMNMNKALIAKNHELRAEITLLEKK